MITESELIQEIRGLDKVRVLFEEQEHHRYSDFFRLILTIFPEHDFVNIIPKDLMNRNFSEEKRNLKTLLSQGKRTSAVFYEPFKLKLPYVSRIINQFDSDPNFSAVGITSKEELEWQLLDKRERKSIMGFNRIYQSSQPTFDGLFERIQF